VIGLGLLAHGANLLLLQAGGSAGSVPIIGDARGAAGVAGGTADPLPQAMVLTAIVIAFGVSAFLLALSYRSWLLTGDDEVQDDLEDRRVQRLGEQALAEQPTARPREEDD
jgi:multicomponent Na+:H+ antiporter subunit C